jgi:transketolase
MATGGIVSEALSAADQLADQGIRVRVVSMHTIKPIDVDAIRSASHETGGIVTVEENTVNGGLGGAVAEVCLEQGIPPRVFRMIGLRAGFSSIVGSQQYLRERYEMDAASIVRTVVSALSERRSVTGFSVVTQ